MRGRSVVWTASLTILLSGCGGGEFETAPVTGLVTCEGTTVAGGTITFNPIAEDAKGKPGKSAMGRVGADGRFVLTTYKEGDGAIVGMHEVFYTPAIPGEGDDGEDEEGAGSLGAAPPKKPTGKKSKLLPCEMGGTARIGVVDGRNDVTIDLTSWIPKVKKDDDEDQERGE
jgi:hypothetical protein